MNSSMFRFMHKFSVSHLAIDHNFIISWQHELRGKNELVTTKSKTHNTCSQLVALCVFHVKDTHIKSLEWIKCFFQLSIRITRFWVAYSFNVYVFWILLWAKHPNHWNLNELMQECLISTMALRINRCICKIFKFITLIELHLTAFRRRKFPSWVLVC